MTSLKVCTVKINRVTIPAFRFLFPFRNKYGIMELERFVLTVEEKQLSSFLCMVDIMATLVL